MKVRANAVYIYDPCILDVIDGRTNLKKGDVVRVKNLHGCGPFTSFPLKSSHFRSSRIRPGRKSHQRRDEWAATMFQRRATLRRVGLPAFRPLHDSRGKP